MEETEVSFKFKRKSYVGKIHLLDVKSKDVVVTGYGAFDTQKLSLKTQFDTMTASSHDSVLTILETPDGYFAPLMLRGFHSMGWSGSQSSSHSMKLSMHWPLSKGIGYILEEFDEIRVAIDAIPEKQELKTSAKTASLTKSAMFANLSKASFSRYSAEANSTFSWTSGNVGVRSEKQMDLQGAMAFIVNDAVGKNFTFLSLNPALLAFKAYWLLAHGSIDCSIRQFKLGADIDFIFDHSKLHSPHEGTTKFRSMISVDADLHLDTLVKCIYFAINPDADDELSISSKTGLSLSALVRHAYGKKPELLDHEAVSLIIGFQGLAEAIAQNKIRHTNKSDKFKTLAEIDKVLRVVRSLEGELSDEVKEFYLKDRDVIYQAFSRPTFKRSIEIALEELGIDKSKHNTTIAAVDKARKQIVHHENYSSDSLMDLITTAKNEVKKDKKGNVVQMSFGIKVGQLDNLYDLMLDMMCRYFDKFTI